MRKRKHDGRVTDTDPDPTRGGSGAESENKKAKRTESADRTPAFHTLPPEMRLHVFGFLDGADAALAMLTCADWYRLIAHDERLWKIYHAKAVGDDVHSLFEPLADGHPTEEDGPFWRWLLCAFRTPIDAIADPPLFASPSNCRLFHTRATCAGPSSRILRLADVSNRKPCLSCAYSWCRRGQDRRYFFRRRSNTARECRTAGYLHEIVWLVDHAPANDDRFCRKGPSGPDYPVSYSATIPVGRYRFFPAHRLYAGGSKDNVPHGRGVEVLIVDDSVDGCSETCASCRPERESLHHRGIERAFRPSYVADVYVGQFHEGERSGRGVCVFRNEMRYEGEWVRGLMHGEGVITCPDGRVYRGRWCDGLYERPESIQI